MTWEGLCDLCTYMGQNKTWTWPGPSPLWHRHSETLGFVKLTWMTYDDIIQRARWEVLHVSMDLDQKKSLWRRNKNEAHFTRRLGVWITKYNLVATPSNPSKPYQTLYLENETHMRLTSLNTTHSRPTGFVTDCFNTGYIWTSWPVWPCQCVQAYG